MWGWPVAQQITSRDNETVKWACRIGAALAARAESGLFLAEGPRLCRDLAENAAPTAVFFTADAAQKWPEVETLCARAADAYEVMPHVAEKLAGTRTPQGVFALFPLPQCGFGDIPEDAPGVLLCESMQDPANVGAVIRTAAGLGLGAVVLAGACADPFGGKALRASMGSVCRVPVVRCGTAAEAAAALREKGFTLYAAALQGAAPVGAKPVKTPFALMIGNEGGGLGAEALAAADERIFLPMENGVESLNAAAAAAVLMYALKAGAGG